MTQETFKFRITARYWQNTFYWTSCPNWNQIRHIKTL